MEMDTNRLGPSLHQHPLLRPKGFITHAQPAVSTQFSTFRIETTHERLANTYNTNVIVQVIFMIPLKTDAETTPSSLFWSIILFSPRCGSFSHSLCIQIHFNHLHHLLHQITCSRLELSCILRERKITRRGNASVVVCYKDPSLFCAVRLLPLPPSLPTFSSASPSACIKGWNSRGYESLFSFRSLYSNIDSIVPLPPH